ncbi:hypothetical protein E9549_20270 [Blastococcus sp. MG754426]|uniref:hypothetical protein n=1 Tax=unclassified Blastococcus TaxID=2619396 RepID=UPI001EF0F216|nr:MULTISPECIES: hypothetical protein [unclassified Blastococcus]MCF6509709.1 hypothetical protein [Blastococcus sp. MG754426]MCF6514103.1 hypothetical protein [Blastococcus sp. MG754427]
MLALLCGKNATVLACSFDDCGSTDVGDGSVDVGYSGPGVGELVAGGPEQMANFAWRLRHLCALSDERQGGCSAMDFRECPQEPGRVVQYLVVQQRRVVRSDGTVLPLGDGTPVPVPAGLEPGDPVGDWIDVRQGCLDITPLNPPPSAGEVLSYFQRLPLPQLTTRHQPPGTGLTGLPVIFYTDSPTTQTFTVDIRGFTLVIEATAEQFTWHTGDATGQITTTDPGAPYPDHTIEHSYRSGTYTAHLTVTWGATFTVDGSAEADVPGTTTTDGPPVTFDVLQARTVLTNPYD